MPETHRKRALVVCILVIAVTILVAVCVYITFFRGTTSGPDFVEAVLKGDVKVDNVKSLEIIVPPVGHDAFSEQEYGSLQRKAVIDAPAVIADFLKQLTPANREIVSLNHAVTDYRAYWKVNLLDGDFYYLYVDVLRDSDTTVCRVEANTRNATNPNGATWYHIEDFRLLFELVGESREIDRAKPERAQGPVAFYALVSFGAASLFAAVLLWLFYRVLRKRYGSKAV